MESQSDITSFATYLSKKPDVTVVDVHGNKYYLHSEALCSASSFFQAALDPASKWKETEDGVISVRFEDPFHIFPEVINFIYSKHSFHVNQHTIGPLLAFSDQLQIPSLRDFLHSKMSEAFQNCPSLLFRKAVEYNHISILEKCAFTLSNGRMVDELLAHALDKEVDDLSTFSWLVKQDGLSESVLRQCIDKKLFTALPLTKPAHQDSVELVFKTGDEWSELTKPFSDLTIKVDCPSSEFPTKFKNFSERYFQKSSVTKIKFQKFAYSYSLSSTTFVPIFETLILHWPQLEWLSIDECFQVDLSTTKLLSQLKNLWFLDIHSPSSVPNGRFSSYEFPALIPCDSLTHISAAKFFTKPFVESLQNFVFLRVLYLQVPKTYTTLSNTKRTVYTHGTDPAEFWPLLVNIFQRCLFLERLLLDCNTYSLCPPPSDIISLSLSSLSLSNSQSPNLLWWFTNACPNIANLSLKKCTGLTAMHLQGFPNLQGFTSEECSFDETNFAVLTKLDACPKLRSIQFSASHGKICPAAEQLLAAAHPGVQHISWNFTLGDVYEHVGTAFPSLHSLETLGSTITFESLRKMLKVCAKMYRLHLKELKLSEKQLRLLEMQVKREFPQVYDLVLLGA